MKRRLHAYCISPPRSGTTSMAGLFSSYYSSQQGPHDEQIINLFLARESGRISREEFRRCVLYLDNKEQLEFNSSFANFWQLEVLAAEFPEAKFILTIRDCYSWLNSFLNYLIYDGSKIPVELRRLLDVLFEKDKHPYAKEERFLQQQGVYALDPLLSYWAKANQGPITLLSQSRLLVIKIPEISGQIGRIARFLGIAPETLDASKSRLNQGGHPDILSKIDRDHLLSKVNLHCKDLMDGFFPGFIYGQEASK